VLSSTFAKSWRVKARTRLRSAVIFACTTEGMFRSEVLMVEKYW